MLYSRTIQWTNWVNLARFFFCVWDGQDFIFAPPRHALLMFAIRRDVVSRCPVLDADNCSCMGQFPVAIPSRKTQVWNRQLNETFVNFRIEFTVLLFAHSRSAADTHGREYGPSV